MNKCILCTFLKMIWNGLRDNTCPSVDKTKEENPLGFWKGLQTVVLTIVGIIVAIPLVAVIFLIIDYVLNWLAYIFVLLFGKQVLEISAIILLSALLLVGVGTIIYQFILWIKIRIACIKAYWIKAKEVCE